MIECRGVSFSYDGAVSALDGVDLNIEDGEFFCILGGNGSGKSTFAKHLNALLQPDTGTVRINGMDASDPELVYDIRSTAGMVFQNPDDQLVATLVEDDVAFGPENLGVPSAQIAQRVREALKGVGLVGFERHETHALSGGQKQRVALAGVLAMEPRVLILDEASSMLDPRGRKGLMKACHALHALYGRGRRGRSWCGISGGARCHARYARGNLDTGGRTCAVQLGYAGVVLLGRGASCEGRARSCAGARGGYGRRDCADICRPEWGRHRRAAFCIRFSCARQRLLCNRRDSRVGARHRDFAPLA